MSGLNSVQLAAISLPGSAVVIFGDVALSIVADAAERNGDQVNFYSRGKWVGSFTDPRAFWFCADVVNDGDGYVADAGGVVESSPGGRSCEKCGGSLAHSRLRGMFCPCCGPVF